MFSLEYVFGNGLRGEQHSVPQRSDTHFVPYIRKKIVTTLTRRPIFYPAAKHKQPISDSELVPFGVHRGKALYGVRVCQLNCPALLEAINACLASWNRCNILRDGSWLFFIFLTSRLPCVSVGLGPPSSPPLPVNAPWTAPRQQLSSSPPRLL